MRGRLADQLRETLHQIEAAGLTKRERVLATPQSARIRTLTVEGPREALNFCANNYLGLADHPDVLAAARDSYDRWGFGMASVRFICGTQQPHIELEAALADFLGTGDAILFSSCYDANGGLFEVLFDAQDAVVSDELNHASIIDGIRLSRARRERYAHADMADLEAILRRLRGEKVRRIGIVTDGVFSMDGAYAPLPEICDLADAYEAVVIVDDSHAVGFVGENGKGTGELLGVHDRVDLWTGTLGKALGGASGGYVAGPAEVIELLRQRARPYLFSNAVAPAVVAGSLAALRIAAGDDEGRHTIAERAALFRRLMTETGFELLPGTHAIVAVMFPGPDGARTATRIADAMLERGVYVIAFSYPVVPEGSARIRVQLSAAHTEQDVRTAVAAFVDSRAEVASRQ